MKSRDGRTRIKEQRCDYHPPEKILTGTGWINSYEALVDGRVVGAAATETEARDKASAHIVERRTAARTRTHAAPRGITGHGPNPFPGLREFEDFC